MEASRGSKEAATTFALTGIPSHGAHSANRFGPSRNFTCRADTGFLLAPIRKGNHGRGRGNSDRAGGTRGIWSPPRARFILERSAKVVPTPADAS